MTSEPIGKNQVESTVGLAGGGLVGRLLGGARCAEGLVLAIGDCRVDLLGRPDSELLDWSKGEGLLLA
jgi:hypothetical protein